MDAIDRSLCLLVSIGVATTSGDLRMCLRGLLRFLLAIRHEYLDECVYGQVATLSKSILDSVHVVVVSASVLNKLQGGTSHWSSWFHSRACGLLLIDELPGQSFEEATVGMFGFRVCVCAGDRNQFMMEHRQTEVIPVLGVPSRRQVCPLDRSNAGEWVEELAKRSASVVSISSDTQYRYGGETIDFIQYVFPHRFVDLQCPLPATQTFVVPHVFQLADTTESWVFRAGPSDRADGGLVIRRHRLVFAQVLAVVAMEMVLAQSRGFRDGKCQLLIMWCLKFPLEELVTFLRGFVVDACWRVHHLLGLGEPSTGYVATYDLSLWISLRRFQYKSAQNAHGSTSEVVLWFLVRRLNVDRGLRGDQTHAAYIFEQCSRATLRQHLFLEDLRHQESLPSVEPFWGEGWQLGIRNASQYRTPTSDSQMGQDGGSEPLARAKRTLTVLRITQYATVDLVERHRSNVFVSGLVKSLSFLCRSKSCKQQLFKESEVGVVLASCPDVVRMEQSLVGWCLHHYDQMSWDDDQHNGSGVRVRESDFSVRSRLQFVEGFDSHYQWFDRWFRFLDAEWATPKCQELPAYDELRNIAAGGSPAGDDGDYDFNWWHEVVLPTLSVHVLGVDRRDGDESYETSPLAMHRVSVCVPFSSCLSDDIRDPCELMVRLAALVEVEYLRTDRGRELLALGVFKRDIRHHKKKEYEYGIYRFVVGACASDRPAATIFFHPNPNTDIRQPVEMLHWYVAMGLSKQHHYQQVMLARVRDIGLAQTLVSVVQRVLCVGHVSVRYMCKDETDNVLLSTLWCESNSTVVSEPMPLVHPGVLAAAKSVGDGTAFCDALPFLSELLSGCPAHALLSQALQLMQSSELHDPRGARSREHPGGVEPQVVYSHESYNCQVPPAEVCLPGVILGSLYWGGMSPVLHLEWLRWRRVTHVLNCMGIIDSSTGNRDYGYSLAQHTRFPDIEYIDWCINHHASRKNYLAVFSRLEMILKHPGSCLYVHCKSGRDRSAIPLYALLRLQFDLSASDAMACLQFRLGRNKWPVARVWDKHDILSWIDDILNQ